MTIITDKRFIARFEDYSYEWTKENDDTIIKKYDWWSSINELGTDTYLSFDNLSQLEEVYQVINELIIHAKDFEAKHGKQDD